MSPRTGTAAAAPRRAPAREQARSRPPLRVVEPGELRRLRPGRVGTIAGTLLFVAMFALAAFQTVIIKEQGTLDDLNGRIREEQIRQRDLALALVELRSPQRITTAARDLGMISPGAVTYLEPSPGDDAAASYQQPDPAPTTTTTSPRPRSTTTTTPPRSRSTATTTPATAAARAPAKTGTGR
ncbi:hypothetical protein [Rhabdothermincola sp.]|uniref:hypothetical protein n=1 Tax=Rhabdothermincola sp. TaxID=2820405 RepID=UPI002FDFDB32